MLNINVTLRDVALNIGRDFTISIDERQPVRDLLAMLVHKLAWPERGIDGEVVRYAMVVNRTNTIFTGNETINSVGLLNGDIITLGPVMSTTYAQPGYPSYSQSQQPGPQGTQAQPQQPYVMTPLKRN